jgi:hypothetical protein
MGKGGKGKAKANTKAKAKDRAELNATPAADSLAESSRSSLVHCAQNIALLHLLPMSISHPHATRLWMMPTTINTDDASPFARNGSSVVCSRSLVAL